MPFLHVLCFITSKLHRLDSLNGLHLIFTWFCVVVLRVVSSVLPFSTFSCHSSRSLFFITPFSSSLRQRPPSSHHYHGFVTLHAGSHIKSTAHESMLICTEKPSAHTLAPHMQSMLQLCLHTCFAAHILAACTRARCAGPRRAASPVSQKKSHPVPHCLLVAPLSNGAAPHSRVIAMFCLSSLLYGCLQAVCEYAPQPRLGGSAQRDPAAFLYILLATDRVVLLGLGRQLPAPAAQSRGRLVHIVHVPVWGITCRGWFRSHAPLCCTSSASVSAPS